jgi:hypothetical protein
MRNTLSLGSVVSIPINSKKLQTELNGPHYTKLETTNLNPNFEFQQLLVSLKHVINLVMRMRDTGCHNVLLVQDRIIPLKACTHDLTSLNLQNWEVVQHRKVH